MPPPRRQAPETRMAGRLRLHIGWSNSLGWYEGSPLLVAVDPTGVISGFGFGSASTADQQIAENLLRSRSLLPERARLGSVGPASSGPYYVVDKGFFEGADTHRRWFAHYA